MKQDKPKTATEVLIEQNRPKHLTATEFDWFGHAITPYMYNILAYGDGYYRPRPFPFDRAIEHHPWPCAKNVADVLYSINDMAEEASRIGRPFPRTPPTQELIDDDIIAAGLAAKNNKKENKMDVESRQYGCHQVVIQKVRNGFIVHVGCEVFVATEWTDVSKALGDYYKDPIAAEKKYCREDKNG